MRTFSWSLAILLLYRQSALVALVPCRGRLILKRQLRLASVLIGSSVLLLSAVASLSREFLWQTRGLLSLIKRTNRLNVLLLSASSLAASISISKRTLVH